MNTFEWQDGEVIQAPYVEIDGVKHYVQGGSFTGTPVTANNLNEMQNILNSNIETANDSDINYVKLIDGTLICWGKTDIFDITYGTAVEREINLPESFVDTSYVVTCSITSGGGFWANGVEFRGQPLTTSSIKLYAGNYISGGTAQNIQGAYIAIGRWK